MPRANGASGGFKSLPTWSKYPPPVIDPIPGIGVNGKGDMRGVERPFVLASLILVPVMLVPVMLVPVVDSVRLVPARLGL